MSSDKPLSQFWWHVIITLVLCLALFPVLPLIYLTGLAIYYGGGWAGQVLRTGSTHRWFYSVRRFAWALGLSVLMSLYVVLIASPQELQTEGKFIGVVTTTVLLLPVWFGILLCCSLPFHAYRLQSRYRDARASETESARVALQQVESERRRQEQQVQARAAQKRCEDARAECELAYALAAPEIAARFSKQDFAEFVTKYMTDKFPPESVEERAEQLKAIIRQHQERVVPTPKFRSIQELAVWFEQRKAEIEAVSDDRHRATLLVQLKERYSELTSQLLAEMTP